MFNFTGKVLSLTAASLMVTTAITSAQSMDELVAAAKAEGQLTTIALPHDWCGYGAVIDAFKKKYPEITVNELNPDAGSGDEIEAIKANKDNKGPQAPDVIDVGPPSVRPPRPTASSSLTRSRPGTRSPTAPRMPKVTGTATITGCSPSR
jgi:ABC-type glycerol-3-phosphate transport system substrate-binding protein